MGAAKKFGWWSYWQLLNVLYKYLFIDTIFYSYEWTRFKMSFFLRYVLFICNRIRDKLHFKFFRVLKKTLVRRVRMARSNWLWTYSSNLTANLSDLILPSCIIDAWVEWNDARVGARPISYGHASPFHQFAHWMWVNMVGHIWSLTGYYDNKWLANAD